MKKIGLFYATKAERTSWVAEKIQKEFGEDKIEVANTEAWEAWKSSLPPQPEPEPTEAERLRADVDFLAAMAGVEL